MKRLKKNPTKKSVTKMNYTWVGIKYGNFYDKNEQGQCAKKYYNKWEESEKMTSEVAKEWKLWWFSFFFFFEFPQLTEGFGFKERIKVGLQGW